MVFVTVCHTFDNNHVKRNFIIFAMNVKVVVISWGKRRNIHIFGPQFCPFHQKIQKLFPLWVKFIVVLMVFAIFCHQLYNIHVKSNLILFAMNTKVMAISWGKTSL